MYRASTTVGLRFGSRTMAPDRLDTKPKLVGGSIQAGSLATLLSGLAREVLKSSWIWAASGHGSAYGCMGVPAKGGS
jgi:hypothetical protein